MDEISDEYENWPDRNIISYVLLIAVKKPSRNILFPVQDQF